MFARNRLIALGAVTGTVFAVAGCATLNRPYPAKRCFALQITQRPERVSVPVSATVQVRQFRVAPPYNTAPFVYKLGEAEFKQDYYDEFIAPPAELVTQQAAAWLCESGIFRTICAGSSAADHDLVLEAMVTSLYGDYTDAAAPQAVLDIHFFLLADSGPQTYVVFERAYPERVSLDGHEPDALVRGWSEGLQRILASLAADLRAAPTPTVSLARE